MCTDQTCTDPSDNDDTQGLARLAQFKDCASAIDRLFQLALMTTGASAFDPFLNLVRSFKGLSVYNAMLVRVQRPGAAAVASRTESGASAVERSCPTPFRSSSCKRSGRCASSMS